MASLKPTIQPRNQNNPVESGRHQGFSGVFASEVKNSVKPLPNDFFNQLLGVGDFEMPSSDTGSRHADMAPGQEFSLPKTTKKVESHQQERRPAIAGGNNYHMETARSSELTSRRESQELKMQIQEISEELKRLINSADKVMQMAYADISVAATPAVVGKYHTHFFAFLLIVIRQARQKVEDSGAWMSVAKGKGGKRSYNVQAKQKGTSFTQSMDRSAATSTG